MENNLSVLERWQIDRRFREKVKRRFMSIVRAIQKYNEMEIEQSNWIMYIGDKYIKVTKKDATVLKTAVIIRNDDLVDYKFDIALSLETDMLTIQTYRQSLNYQWEIPHSWFHIEIAGFCSEEYQKHIVTKSVILRGIWRILINPDK